LKKTIPLKPHIGLVNGLYATKNSVGGITSIECFKFLSETRLKLELTGSQGDVMKESMKVALTVCYNLLSETEKNKIRKEKSFGIHLHCPDGATPKDGPSAGIGICLAIYSLLTNTPVKNDYALTGEIDLNGNATAIGGLYSKLEGAKLAGVKLVLIPLENKQDLEFIRNDKKNTIEDSTFKVKFVSHIKEVLDVMLIKN
jgi:ATP-dependent Lon protease